MFSSCCCISGQVAPRDRSWAISFLRRKAQSVIPFGRRLRLFAFFLPLAALLCSPQSNAQSADAAFGNVYGSPTSTTSTTVYSLVQGTEAIRGSFYGGGSSQTPGGTISVPSSLSLGGEGQLLSLPIMLTTNTSGGSLSGSFTASYTCQSDCTQSSLSIYVTSQGDDIVATATAGLKYQVLAILYDPPGNLSSTGFSNSVSAGATTSVSDNFSSTDSLSFSSGFLGLDNSVTFSASQSAGSSSSYTTSYQAGTGSQLDSNTQAIEHTQDQIYLLVDPTFTVAQTGESSGSYSIGPSMDATGNFAPYGGVPPDMLYSNIAGLESPANDGIPLLDLEPWAPDPGTTLPGLDVICANPLPPSQCTQQNACGCTPADFATIVSQDELANDTDQSTPPSTIDPNRYVYYDNARLVGPQQAGSDETPNTVYINDSSMSSETTSDGTGYSVGYSQGFSLSGLFSLSIKAGSTFTFSQTQTAGASNGQAHTATVTLDTSDVGCSESVDIYEDTTYHTFAFALSEPPPASCQ
ncbi:MAG: hypothetical protein ACP5E5_15160 [Acidobacteriaceae bacterium]